MVAIEKSQTKRLQPLNSLELRMCSHAGSGFAERFLCPLILTSGIDGGGGCQRSIAMCSEDPTVKCCCACIVGDLAAQSVLQHCNCKGGLDIRRIKFMIKITARPRLLLKDPEFSPPSGYTIELKCRSCLPTLTSGKSSTHDRRSVESTSQARWPLTHCHGWLVIL